MLDRNGLRPSRYYVTKDDLVVMASEVGVLDIPPERILREGPPAAGAHVPGRHRAGPHHRRRGDQAADRRRSSRTASGSTSTWSRSTTCRRRRRCIEPDHETVLQRQEAFGYTFEDLQVLIAPMASDGVEAIGSMGNDTPLAVLSNKPQLLYNYFKQLFAQVTNPPIDAIREEIIMAVDTALGPEGNLLEPPPASARQIELPTPVLRNEELAKLRNLDGGAGAHGFKSVTLPILFDVAAGGAGLRAGDRGRCARRPARPSPTGNNILILSDRGHDRERAPIPALLAVAAVHHHLIREGPRTRVGLVLETRRAARGAPLRAADRLRRERHQPVPGLRDPRRHDRARACCRRRPQDRPCKNYVKAVDQGHRQGHVEDGHLDHPELPRRAGVRGHRPATRTSSTSTSPGPPSRIGGIGIDVIAEEVPPAPPARLPRAPARRAHALRAGRPVPVARATASTTCSTRRRIHKLQNACRTGNYERLQGVRAADQRPVAAPVHAARPAGVQVDRARRCRSRRSSRSRRS